jgi:RimJ/RimL family protein N-acetyltransferase
MKPAMSRFLLSSPLQVEAQGVRSLIRDGTAVLRPLKDGETEPLQQVFDGLSTDSRAARYLSPPAALTADLQRVLTAVDGRVHVAWLASIAGHPAGIARYIRVGPHTAEVAFEVVDEHQGRGLGTVLLDTVTTVAAAAGIQRLQAFVLGSNRASRHLLRLVGVQLSPGEGMLEADSPFSLMTTARVNRPAVVRVALQTHSWASATLPDSTDSLSAA